ncbi:hypothetical protein GCM10010211_63590 [Streptomyces albospinus]|uniref:Uncharacterized protein n=1 Tax=Streptomyces albospinus TaxID=285515 RepID=A0ABQ2VI84_9ACTN|nr:hypothetical protein [Streptomyces albospinus]GGU88426.1 hypothetical protein GCM10010211_63590 [Streptomyces albospinus]
MYEESYTAAVQAGDSALAGNALAFLAYQKTDGDRHAGIEIAQTACRYLSWLAESYLSAGEVEQATSVTSRAMELSTGVASVRPRRRIARTLRRLRAHRELPVVAELLDQAEA